MNLNYKTRKLIKIIGMLALIVGLGSVITACSSKSSNSNTTNDRIANDGSFIVGKNGTMKNTDKTSDKPTMDIYMDPLCPSCGDFDRKAGSIINEHVAQGKLLVRYHPLMFLDQNSTDEYSTRGSSYLLGVAQFAPNVVQKFISGMYDKTFQPDEAKYKPTTNAQLRTLFTSVGGTNKQADQIDKHMKEFADVTYNATTRVMQDKSLIHKSPTGQLYTPFVLPNKPGKDDAKALLVTDNPQKQVKSVLNNIEK